MKRFLKLLAALMPLALLAVSVWGWYNHQDIRDWLRLRDYQPPAAITRLASETSMTEEGRRIFYVQHPELNGRTAFQRNCSGFGEQTIVLGCYISSRGIYLFNINEARLDGVKQTTAAHEMLHAAYERLSTQERARVDSMTARTFTTLNDERIRNTIENYRRRDPSVVPNELHSIIATEVRHIPADLEAYYKRYFTDRLQVVAHSERYESVLTAQRARASTLEIEITALQNEISELERALTSERASLEQQRPLITTQAQADSFNQRIGNYNQQVSAFNGLIARHNDLVEQFKANAVERNSLYQALDSRPRL